MLLTSRVLSSLSLTCASCRKLQLQSSQNVSIHSISVQNNTVFKSNTRPNPCYFFTSTRRNFHDFTSRGKDMFDTSGECEMCACALFFVVFLFIH